MVWTKRRRIVALLLTLIPSLLCPRLFPSCPILFLVPLLVSFFSSLPALSLLWLSFGAGLIYDLTLFDTSFGIPTAAFCMATLLIYPLRHSFFTDSFWAIPCLSTLYSMALAISELTLIGLITTLPSLSWTWAWTDLFLMPLLDGFYALVGFSVPLLMIKTERAPPSRYAPARPK